MTTTASYADRYVSAVARTVPADSRSEIIAELRASIADEVEPRVAAGEDQADAERHVVGVLGEPTAYAASLIDRPMWLVGPRYYAAWLRLLRLLLWIVPICGVAGVLLGQLIARATVGEVIGSVVAVLIGAIVHVCFWTTLVFFVLERTGSTGETILEWDPDQLPQPAERGAARTDLIASLVFLGLAVGAIVWDRTLGFFPTGGDPVPVLDPALWPWGIAAFFALILAEALLALAVYRRRQWTTGLAVTNTVLAVAFAAVSLTLLVRGELINPEFVAFVVDAGGEGFARGEEASAGQGGVFGILGAIVGFGLVAFPAWDIVDGWLKVRRTRSI